MDVKNNASIHIYFENKNNKMNFNDNTFVNVMALLGIRCRALP